MIYLDNAATTPPIDQAIAAATRCMRENFGNPSSLHELGRAAENELTKSRTAILKALDSDGDLYFTSGGTESNNLAIIGAANRMRTRQRIITSASEHASVLNTFKHLENLGFNVVYLPVDQFGGIDLDALEYVANDDVQLISIAHVNNETGAINPIKAVRDVISRKCPNALLHIDCVQSFCKLPIPLDAIDLASISAHKIHGIKGAGALYAAKGVKLAPIVHGGNQQKGIRSGTENVPAIAALGEACSILAPNMQQNYAHVSTLRDIFLSTITKHPNIKKISGSDCSPYIISFSAVGKKAEVLLHMLEQRGIYVSTGSACSSNSSKRNHALLATGLSPTEVDGSLRVSFNPYITQEQAAEAANAVVQAINNM